MIQHLGKLKSICHNDDEITQFSFFFLSRVFVVINQMDASTESFNLVFTIDLWFEATVVPDDSKEKGKTCLMQI